MVNETSLVISLLEVVGITLPFFGVLLQLGLRYIIESEINMPTQAMFVLFLGAASLGIGGLVGFVYLIGRVSTPQVYVMLLFLYFAFLALVAAITHLFATAFAISEGEEPPESLWDAMTKRSDNE